MYGPVSPLDHADSRKKAPVGYLWLVVIGALAGWLSGQFMRGYGLGLIGDIAVGISGAFIGRYVFRATGAEIAHGHLGSLIVAFIGAELLLLVVRLYRSHRVGRGSRS